MNHNTLLDQLKEAFANSNPPGKDELINHICPDCLNLRDDFQGKKWQNKICGIKKEWENSLENKLVF